MVSAASGLVICASCVFGQPSSQLSTAEVIRISDVAARSAVHRGFTEFSRRHIYYQAQRREWTVVYQKVVGTTPRELRVSVSDSTRRTHVTFNDYFTIELPTEL